MLLATHIVSTTYMTWPPGDPRGHWSPLFDLYGKLIAAGHQLNLPHQPTLDHATSLANELPKILTPEEIQIISATFSELLTHPPGKPGARCYAAAFEPTHIHLLLNPLNSTDRKDTIGRLKGRSSAELKKLPQNSSRTRTWTTGYWFVDIYDNLAFSTIRTYITNHNTRKGLAPHPYPWTVP